MSAKQTKGTAAVSGCRRSRLRGRLITCRTYCAGWLFPIIRRIKRGQTPFGCAGDRLKQPTMLKRVPKSLPSRLKPRHLPLLQGEALGGAGRGRGCRTSGGASKIPTVTAKSRATRLAGARPFCLLRRHFHAQRGITPASRGGFSARCRVAALLCKGRLWGCNTGT